MVDARQIKREAESHIMWSEKGTEPPEFIHGEYQYVIACYDTLHTLGKEYLVEDITEFVKEKGIHV